MGTIASRLRPERLGTVPYLWLRSQRGRCRRCDVGLAGPARRARSARQRSPGFETPGRAATSWRSVIAGGIEMDCGPPDGLPAGPIKASLLTRRAAASPILASGAPGHPTEKRKVRLPRARRRKDKTLWPPSSLGGIVLGVEPGAGRIESILSRYRANPLAPSDVAVPTGGSLSGTPARRCREARFKARVESPRSRWDDRYESASRRRSDHRDTAASRGDCGRPQLRRAAHPAYDSWPADQRPGPRSTLARTRPR